MDDSLPLVDLGIGGTVANLALYADRSCAILDTAASKCWGKNTSGVLGIGDTADRGDDQDEMGGKLPTISFGGPVMTPFTAIAIPSGRGDPSCVLLGNGMVKCWGENGSGRLGLGDTIPRGAKAADMGDNLPAVLLQ